MFYEVIWNRHDKSAIPEVLHKTFIFRGSLEVEIPGHEGFAEYLDIIHSALGNYKCIIKETVSEQSKVFAKMQFTGIYQGTSLGIEPTGNRVSWDGAAFFQFKCNKFSSL